MNTRHAFYALHKIRDEADINNERRTWGEATWFFKKDRRKRLSELQA